MHRTGQYFFKFAESDEEIAQIHKLNYETFVREIPQHHDNGTGQLVDKYHDKNHYIIAKKDDEIVGMLCANGVGPFSVESRLSDPSIITSDGKKPVEIRLLSVKPEERHSAVVNGLVFALFQFANDAGYTHFVISGVVEQEKFYEHIGFTALGPAVGQGRAQFIPMIVSLPEVERKMKRTMQLWQKRLTRSKAQKENEEKEENETMVTAAQKTIFVSSHARRASAQQSHSKKPVCFLPGPVAISDEVTEAFHQPLVYHRAQEFIPLYERVRSRLTDMTGGQKKVALFVGSGTIGNDVVGATLSADPQRLNGLVLINGEFGHRIEKQAKRWALQPKTLTWDWGQPYDFQAIEQTFATMQPGGWVWAVHHETSTGVLNDLPRLIRLARQYQIRICVDCVSSLATVPVDLTGTYLATGASGKAVGSYAGIAFVFADPAELKHLDPETIPTYLDLISTIKTVGPRFTVPSPLIASLDTALESFATDKQRKNRFQQIASQMSIIRKAVNRMGLAMLSEEANASPAMITFAPPEGYTASEIVAKLYKAGYQIAGQSGYLAERNLIQIAIMGQINNDQVFGLVRVLERLIDRKKKPQKNQLTTLANSQA